jgi:CO dehydrogenase maturation factor
MTMRHAMDARTRDWAKLTRQAAQFHLRNARAWANSATGENLEGQVDQDFILGPHMPLRVGA